jgi:hypothetical protein
VSFVTVNIDDVVCEGFNNISIYDIIIDKLLKNNTMLNNILTK